MCLAVGFMVDIIRNGQSLVLEDGSLQLVMEDKDDAGSGIAPGPLPLQDSMGRMRRENSALLSAKEMILPSLPASVDEILISWFASVDVS